MPHSDNGLANATNTNMKTDATDAENTFFVALIVLIIFQGTGIWEAITVYIISRLCNN